MAQSDTRSHKKCAPDADATSPKDDLKRWQTNPGILFLLIMLSIFSSEVLVMIILGNMPRMSRYVLPFLDSLLLSVLVFPLLYLLFFRPMRIYFDKCQSLMKQAGRSRASSEDSG